MEVVCELFVVGVGAVLDVEGGGWVTDGLDGDVILF